MMAAIILCRPGEDLEVLASTNIVSGKRDRRRKQRGGSEDDRVERGHHVAHRV